MADKVLIAIRTQAALDRLMRVLDVTPSNHKNKDIRHAETLEALADVVEKKYGANRKRNKQVSSADGG